MIDKLKNWMSRFLQGFGKSDEQIRQELYEKGLRDESYAVLQQPEHRGKSPYQVEAELYEVKKPRKKKPKPVEEPVVAAVKKKKYYRPRKKKNNDSRKL